MKDFNKKFGFTLSEVLITLGIIGIVAVLTIPAVMKNYRNRLYVAQLQKTYAQISEAEFNFSVVVFLNVTASLNYCFVITQNR